MKPSSRESNARSHRCRGTLSDNIILVHTVMVLSNWLIWVHVYSDPSLENRIEWCEWELCWKNVTHKYWHKHTQIYGSLLPIARSIEHWALAQSISIEQTQPYQGVSNPSSPFGNNYLCALYSQRTCYFLPFSGVLRWWKMSTNLCDCVSQRSCSSVLMI